MRGGTSREIEFGVGSTQGEDAAGDLGVGFVRAPATEACKLTDRDVLEWRRVGVVVGLGVMVQQERVFRVDGMFGDWGRNCVGDLVKLVGTHVLELLLFVDSTGHSERRCIERPLDCDFHVLGGRLWKMHDRRTDWANLQLPLENAAQTG